MTHTTMRLAEPTDLDTIVHIAERINAESNHGFSFDPGNAREHLWAYIANDGWDILCAEHNGEIVGGAMMASDTEFHDKPLGYVCKFWVLPEGRRSDAARRIIQACIDWAREHNCTKLFATATAGLEEREQKLFVNLMKRAGLEDQGPVMGIEL